MKNNTIIFGDSYSTFAGFIPEGYETYYSENIRPETDVIDVSQTWWHQVAKEENLNLVLNNSWSGSTVGYTSYGGADCSASSSFIYRLKKLIAEGFFEKNEIQKVFVFGGTNDSWSNAPLGEIKKGDWEKSDLYSVLPAIYYFLNLLKQTLPNAQIYCLINTELKPQIADCILKASEEYGLMAITFDKIDKNCGHPTIKGMSDIKTSVLKAIRK